MHRVVSRYARVASRRRRYSPPPCYRFSFVSGRSPVAAQLLFDRKAQRHRGCVLRLRRLVFRVRGTGLQRPGLPWALGRACTRCRGAVRERRGGRQPRKGGRVEHRCVPACCRLRPSPKKARARRGTLPRTTDTRLKARVRHGGTAAVCRKMAKRAKGSVLHVLSTKPGCCGI